MPKGHTTPIDADRWLASLSVVRARRAARLTQRELAERTGIDQAAIARIESGLVRPRVDTLQTLLHACGWILRAEPGRPVPASDVDRSELRRILALSDRDREAYYLTSNRNMLATFASRPAR